MSDATVLPSVATEVVAAMARMNSKDFGLSCAAFARLVGVPQGKLRGIVFKAQADLKLDLPFKVHGPASEPADLAHLLSEIAMLLRGYLVITDGQADCMALWVAHTHLFDLFPRSPLMIVNAPEPACGKTLVQEILASMSQRSLSSANATVAALFRLAEAHAPTLFIDEADTFFGANKDLHGLVNSGYMKGVKFIRTETVGDNFVVKTFDVFCPKSLAGIALERHLPEATMSRGVVINMRRKLADDKVERWRHVDHGHVERLAQGLAWIAANCREEIAKVAPVFPAELGDRDQDNWNPLLAIARFAGADWEARAMIAAIEISGKSSHQESVSHELLRDLRDCISEYEAGTLKLESPSSGSRKYISTANLRGALTDYRKALTWGTYNRGEPLTDKQLAKLLRPYQIRPKTVRIKEGVTPKGYEIAALNAAILRYVKDDDEVVDDAEDETRLPDPPHDGQLPPQPGAAY